MSVMFQGSLVALVTPMKPDGVIDYSSLQKLIDFHIDAGSDGLVLAGTTGESATLTMEQHCQLIARSVEYAAGRIPIIAGTGANATDEAIELTRCAQQGGADACLLVTPYYNKPTQQGLYRHYQAVAEAVDIPQILYNVPGRTACDMLPQTVQRLAEIDNIVGIKEATGDMDRARMLIDGCGPDFAVISGDDATAMELILLGGRGDISVTANVAPKAMQQMCKAALAGDRQRAEELNQTLLGLHKSLFVESNPIPVKWALQQMGLIDAGIRLPMTWLAEDCQQEVKQAMQQAGVL